MNEKQKEQIREALRLYVMKYPSQNKAAASLHGTSAGTVSSGAERQVGEHQRRHVAKDSLAGGNRHPGAWQMVETTAAKRDGLCDD